MAFQINKGEILKLLDEMQDGADFSDVNFCKQLLFIIYQNVNIVRWEDPEINTAIERVLTKGFSTARSRVYENVDLSGKKVFSHFYPEKIQNYLDRIKEEPEVFKSN